jgi:hypothetical protein
MIPHFEYPDKRPHIIYPVSAKKSNKQNVMVKEHFKAILITHKLQVVTK